MLDNHVADVRPVTPPPITPRSEPYSFRPTRSVVLETLKDEINRLSEINR